VILPDVNLLLYAHNSSAPSHNLAARWWRECLAGTETVGLTAPVAFGFLRIVTLRVFPHPLSPAVAVAEVSSWLRRAQVEFIDITIAAAHRALGLLEAAGTAGNLVTDAQIAAVALQHNAVVHTADADFSRFPGVRWFNPITGQRGR